MAGYIVAASNFAGEGTAPVASFAGVGPYGTYDTAGNVKEWCSTGRGDGSHDSPGSAFNKPDYMFAGDSLDSFSREDSQGFRCVQYVTPPPEHVADNAIKTPPYHLTTDPIDEDQFKLIRAMYSYTRRPLHAELSVGRKTETWTEKIVTVDAAYGGRLSAHIFEPNQELPSDQVLVVFPGSGARHQTEIRQSEYGFRSIERLIESGRTVVWPIYAGMYGRPEVYKDKDTLIRQSQDLSRCIDYLQETEEYATAQIGYIGFSLGAEYGPMFIAIERRVSLGMLVNGGLKDTPDPAESNPYNFAPRVNVPILMINGSHDSLFPVDTSQKPLLETLGTPPERKKHVIIPGGHGVDPVFSTSPPSSPTRGGTLGTSAPLSAGNVVKQTKPFIGCTSPTIGAKGRISF